MGEGINHILQALHEGVGIAAQFLHHLGQCGGSGSIVGVWKMDIDAVLEMAGISKVEYEAVKSLVGEMEATVEFTKDGKCITKISMMGQTETEESEYKVDGNILTMNGEAGEFKINGNKLTLTTGGQSLTLTRK